MKRTCTMIAAMLILLAPLAAQRITVVSPNGGETLVKWDLPFPITWTATDVSQKVKIILLKRNGDRFGVIAEDLQPDSSPYRWLVGRTGRDEVPVGEYEIRVATMDGTTKDNSDRTFSIVENTIPGTEPTLTVTSPRAGDSWQEGDRHDITWDASGLRGIVHIYLKKPSHSSGLVPVRVVDVTEESIHWTVAPIGEASPGTVEPADYRIVMQCGEIEAESGNFGITRTGGGGNGEGHDFAVSDPYLEYRSGSQGFRMKVTDLGGDYEGWLTLSYWCGKMGLGNAIQERRRVELRRGVPATVRFSNLRSSYFDNECDVNFVFTINPDHEVRESNYGNNATQERFCWHARDGRFIELRIGGTYIHADEAAQVAIRPADVGNQRVEGGKIDTRLEITVRNCGNEAITSGIVRVTNTWRFHDGHGGSEEVAVIRIRSMEPKAFRLLNCTVPIAYCRESNEIRIVFECGESGALNANNTFHCHPNFIGF